MPEITDYITPEEVMSTTKRDPIALIMAACVIILACCLFVLAVCNPNDQSWTDRLREEGYRAAQAGVSVSDCPYKTIASGGEGKYWQQGWIQYQLDSTKDTE